jgi:hypothetical protein
MLDRTMLSYSGVAAGDVANAERVTIDAVRESRERLGRRPSDGQPVSVHREQAEHHAQRARDLQRAGMDPDAQVAWGEANYQAAQAVLDELEAIAKLMRSNRNPSL